MKGQVILDTGPLVALLNGRDFYHQWAKIHVGEMTPPLLTCEAVLSEACFLLRHVPNGPKTVMEMVKQGIVTIPFHLEEETVSIHKLLVRYANVPASLADVCLIRMAEQNVQSVIITLDSDFHIYRKHGRQVIPTIIPDDLEE